eukprot:g59461.t1
MQSYCPSINHESFDIAVCFTHDISATHHRTGCWLIDWFTGTSSPAEGDARASERSVLREHKVRLLRRDFNHEPVSIKRTYETTITTMTSFLIYFDRKIGQEKLVNQEGASNKVKPEESPFCFFFLLQLRSRSEFEGYHLRQRPVQAYGLKFRYGLIQ